MTETDRPERRPFGERTEDDKNAPFGARPPRRASSDSMRPSEPPIPARQPYREEPPPPEEDDVLVPFTPRREENDDEPGTRAYERTHTRIEDVTAGGEPNFYTPTEPLVKDEPPDAPSTIQVRSQRHRATAPSILKRPAPEPAFTSYPELDAQEKEAQQKKQAAQQRATVTLRLRVIAQTILGTVGAAVVLATLFTWWTPNSFLPPASVEQLSVALATQGSAPQVNFLPTLTPFTNETQIAAQNTVGIVSGHRGLNPTTGLPDPGALCEDGLTEQGVVEEIANQSADLLRGQGYTVTVFDEFDPRLVGFSARALISIHADSCEYINDEATGFKVASFAESSNPDQDSKLVGCLITRYGETTEMPFHPSVTFDMTQYHTFREIAPGTPGAIVEVGFLFLDRDFLTTNANIAALGVARGVLCYLRDEPISPNNEATPSAEPGAIPDDQSGTITVTDTPVP